MSWKKELSDFLTGEAYVADASTWYLKHKDFGHKTGYNLLGQYQGKDYDYYVWVGVAAPEGYGITEAKGEVMRLVAKNYDYFGLKALQAYDDNFRPGVLFATDSDAQEACDKIKALAPTGPTGGGSDILKIALGVLTALVLAAVIWYVLKK